MSDNFRINKNYFTEENEEKLISCLPLNIYNIKRNVLDDYTKQIIESLDNITHSLDKKPLDLSDEDLESLAYLSESKIVGLGEATHGTKEFFQLKHRIFKYLVENYDYKIFAFECDLGESYYVDNFVTNGEGDLDYIMIHIMHFWTWCTEEVKELLLWMREYNVDKPDEEKIHFIGVDCQFLSYQADIIKNYYNKSNISLPNESLQFLNEIGIDSSNIYNFYSEMTSFEKDEIDNNVDELLSEIEKSKDHLISASSEFEYELIKRIALNIKQVNDFQYKYAHESFNNRDFYMAQNTLWTSELFGNNSKIAVWAHNQHLINADFYFSTGTMGYHIKEALKEEYQIVNFGFSYGSFTAISPRSIIFNMKNNIICPPPKSSCNYIFHHAEDEHFILREIDIVENSSFDNWISQTRSLLNIGASFFFHSYIFYYSYNFKEYADIMIYWDKTTASELLY